MKDKKGVLIGLFLGMIVMGLVYQTQFFLKKEKVVETKKEIIVDEESIATEVVEKATPSVVTVSMAKNISDTFNSNPANVEQDIGTGFIISSDGLIVTNKHVVVDLQAEYKVIIGKDETAEVVNIYRDPINDLAILKVNKNNLTPVVLGDSDKLKAGQTVIAIGTALGEFRSTVTKGVISGLGRGITAGNVGGAEKLDDVIQVDAAINLGNSGGPLFNSNGEVIGVNVAVSSNGQSIGFALPINIVKQSVDNFRNTGEFDRSYLGVAYKVVTKQLAEANKIPMGNYVQMVMSESPAEKAGIKTGDIIIEIDGQKISDDNKVSLAKIVNQKKIGDELKIKYVREGKEFEIKVKLEKKI